MQSRLEDVLREKEGELKLYQRFLNLRTFCETRIFPLANAPLHRHIETLKAFTEQLIPEPRERTQEMFSGEIFVLLCLLYLHDAGIVSSYDWSGNDDIYNRMDKSSKSLLINADIAKRLDIPDSAMELINALIFYPSVKKIPGEWEIREDSRRAIIRNPRIIEEIFSFAHLMGDIFSSDATNIGLNLRRFRYPSVRLRSTPSFVQVDSREGILTIHCAAEIPYEVHLLEIIKGYIEGAFKKFKEAVNGRLGFQYKSLVWDIGQVTLEQFDVPRYSHPASAFFIAEIPERWDEASLVFDRLFKNRHVIMIGPRGCGKTTLMESFMLPQLRRISGNVFRAEVWQNPANELRESIALVQGVKSGASSDLVSVCNRLRQSEACFFILDCCERLQYVDEGEKEKLQRFVEFCVRTDNVYLVLLGDEEDFFEWYHPFNAISLSAIVKVMPATGKRDGSAALADMVSGDALKEMFRDMLKEAGSKAELREVVAVLVGKDAAGVARCSVSDIRAETGLSVIRIVDYLKRLKERGIIKEHRSFDFTYYTLISRHLIEPLREYLKLSEFDEKRTIRADVARTARSNAWLSPETLDVLNRWTERLILSGEEMAVVLGSAIYHGRSPHELLRRLDGRGKLGPAIRSDIIVRLLNEPDVEKRRGAVELLSEIRDDHMVNGLLSHLKREEDYTVKGLIVGALIATGKKKTLVALMRTLTEIEDTQWKVQVVNRLAETDPVMARDGLLLLAETEKDTETLEAIEKAFAKLEESL